MGQEVDRRPVLETAGVRVALEVPGRVEERLDQAGLLEQVGVLLGWRRAVARIEDVAREVFAPQQGPSEVVDEGRDARRLRGGVVRAVVPSR
ncbi:hypothetical protein ACU4GR_27420 [Methylobacterium oryzae CBMB20]